MEQRERKHDGDVSFHSSCTRAHEPLTTVVILRHHAGISGRLSCCGSGTFSRGRGGRWAGRQRRRQGRSLLQRAAAGDGYACLLLAQATVS